jgi:peptidoglycan/xylan/chitin deacetylase (PgdA/CDA1 family)
MLDPFWHTLHAVGFSTCAVLAYGTFVPSSQLWGRTILRAPPAAEAGGSPSVALTFDDGPTDGPTDRVLDLLGGAGVKAAFFVIGQNCRRCPRLLRRIHDEGHLVANHTWDHSHASWRGLRRYWDDQLTRTGDAIAEVVGRRPAIFRPPMGIKTAFTLAAARAAGCATVGWTRRARDGGPTTATAILGRLLGRATAGDILLLHDGAEPNRPDRDPEPTLAALPALLDGLKARGLGAARLDELLGLPGYQ